jgi:hypothetical protein
MLTRGRRSNHLYLQVVGDGDPHTIIRPETITPRTPTEMLEQLLARDEAPTSASTMLRQVRRASLFPDCGPFKVRSGRRGIHGSKTAKVFAGVS